MLDAGRICPPRPGSPGLDPVRISPRGGGRMRIQEFMKYLIVLALVMAAFVAVAG